MADAAARRVPAGAVSAPCLAWRTASAHRRAGRATRRKQTPRSGRPCAGPTPRACPRAPVALAWRVRVLQGTAGHAAPYTTASMNGAGSRVAGIGSLGLVRAAPTAPSRSVFAVVARLRSLGYDGE